jgi:hypothetical protein
MASRLDFSQIRSLYVGTIPSTTVDTNNLIVVGNVGIGTTGPETKLQVEQTIAGDAGGMLYLKNSTESSGTYTGIYFGTWGRKSGIFHKQGSYGGYGTGDLIFATNSALNGTVVSPSDARMTITNPGNVGIGTTSPNKQLTFAQSADDAIQIRRLTTSQGNPSAGTGISWTWTSSGTDNETWAAIRVIMPGSGNTNMTFSTTPVSGGGSGLTERMRITDAGNVGIGTTSPGQKLDVVGTIKAGIAGNSSANIPALLVTSSGTLNEQAAIAIQQATSEGDTIIFADYEPYVEWGISTENSGNKIQFTAGTSTGSLGSKTLYNNAGTARTAYIKFDHDLTSGQTLIGGNVGIGTTAPAYKLDVSGTIRATGDVIAYSDARVKENVETIDGALNKVLKMRGVSYNKIGEQEKKVGVIAQEILDVLPEVVSQDETGTYSVAYGNIVSVLIEAIKEQQKQIDELKSKFK